jgi:hypothetical protein
MESDGCYQIAVNQGDHSTSQSAGTAGNTCESAQGTEDGTFYQYTGPGGNHEDRGADENQPWS